MRKPEGSANRSTVYRKRDFAERVCALAVKSAGPDFIAGESRFQTARSAGFFKTDYAADVVK